MILKENLPKIHLSHPDWKFQIRESLSQPFDQEVGCVQGSLSGLLLFSLLVNNISEALKIGKNVCYPDDSHIIFDGDSWDEVCEI